MNQLADFPPMTSMLKAPLPIKAKACIVAAIVAALTAAIVSQLADSSQPRYPIDGRHVENVASGPWQNDVNTAVTAFNNARTQVMLSEASEKRRHDLYLSKAVAPADWRQGQADLAAAQSNLRRAKIALDTVRNRLRILGKSDEEINALESAQGSQPMHTTAPPQSTSSKQ